MMGPRVDDFIVRHSSRLDLFAIGIETSEGEACAARISEIEGTRTRGEEKQ